MWIHERSHCPKDAAEWKLTDARTHGGSGAVALFFHRAAANAAAELCDVAVDGAYTCLNYTDSAFVLLIRDSGYVGDEDSASRVADPNYVSTVADLPDDTGLYPHIDNCYLYDVAKLEIPSDIDQFVLAGGDTYRAYYKGRVGYLNFNSNFIANQSQITRVFPDQLTALTKLEELSLEGNYISTLGKTDVIPTLKSLNLASNNITVMPTSLSNHENLESLNLGSNKIKEVSSSDSSDTLTMLNLSDNSIVTFEATYPNLETLYLGNNNLTEIPDAVYDCTKLKHLYLSGKNPSLLSPIFTEDQFQFLQDLDTLDVAEDDFDTQTGTLHEWTQQKLQIALEVAEALVYLHSFAPPVLHRNLSASDVLLTSGMKAKVSKIGVSHLRVMASGDKDQQTAMGPWQAPEVLMGADDRDPAVDIFSFGVLLSELDTHAPPYNDARSLSGTQLADAVVLQMIAAGAIRLRFGEDCPPDLRSLADSCLAKNPRMRPAASEVVYALRTIKKLV
ncbi:hypothetical protein PRIC1_010057 [Phytophthora ramorum]